MLDDGKNRTHSNNEEEMRGSMDGCVVTRYLARRSSLLGEKEGVMMEEYNLRMKKWGHIPWY